MIPWWREINSWGRRTLPLIWLMSAAAVGGTILLLIPPGPSVGEGMRAPFGFVMWVLIMTLGVQAHVVGHVARRSSDGNDSV